MNKKIIIANLAVLLFMPFLFVRPGESSLTEVYLRKCVVPLLIVGVFCLNYYRLIPRAMNGGGKSNLIVANAVIVTLCCISLAGWHKVEFAREHNVRAQTELSVKNASSAGKHDSLHKRKGRSGRRFWIVATIFDAVVIIFTMLVAYSIRSNEHIAMLQKRQQEAEVARQQAELKRLRNQVSPHFLLNTLNNIYSLAAISSERTQSAVMQLSKLLRHMLYDNQSEKVTLRSEAEFIKSYIELMRLRLTNNVRIITEINVAENSSTLVAPLLYISLVENAFKHGVSSTEQCVISISLHEDAHNIVCDIFNSNHPKKSSDHSGHGIGLNNVQKRLDSIYPNRYEWIKGVAEDGLYHSKIVINK